MDTQVAIVRIVHNIHADVAHMDRAKNIYTEVATIETVGSISAVVGNSRLVCRVHGCDHCVDISHCCHGCRSVYIFIAVSTFAFAIPPKDLTYADMVKLST